MKVHWTDTAEGHLDAIYAYIALDSPEYAKRVIDRLTRRSQQIADFPLSGRRVPEYDADQIREVIEGPSGATRCRTVECTQEVAVVPGMFLPDPTQACHRCADDGVRSPADNVPNWV